MCSLEVCGKCEMYESIKQSDSVDMVCQINRSTVIIVAYMSCKKKYGKVNVVPLAVPLIKPGCGLYGIKETHLDLSRWSLSEMRAKEDDTAVVDDVCGLGFKACHFKESTVRGVKHRIHNI